MQCPHGFVLQISHFITDFERKILCSTSSNLSYQAPYPLHRIMGNLAEENNPKLRNFTPSLIKPWFCCLRGELVPSTLGSPEVFADHKTAGSVVRHVCCFFVKESERRCVRRWRSWERNMMHQLGQQVSICLVVPVCKTYLLFLAISSWQWIYRVR